MNLREWLELFKADADKKNCFDYLKPPLDYETLCFYQFVIYSSYLLELKYSKSDV